MLVVSNLDAGYGDSHVLHGINITVDVGSRVAVLGRNGAGKSTLLKSIVTEDLSVSGQITYREMDVASLSTFRRARVGLAFVPEDRRIFPSLTVEENMMLATKALSSRDSFTANEMFKMFPLLKPLRSRLGYQLSGGQQQLLAVARAIAPQPSILFLDEPTEGLAPIIVSSLAEVILSYCQTFKASLVLCEQNVRFARHCTDYLYVLSSGQIVFEGEWDTFDGRADLTSRYLAVSA